ncbi:MAG: hypothetical protein ACRDTD_08150 [Pseudonocardiaceae bacterium]
MTTAFVLTGGGNMGGGPGRDAGGLAGAACRPGPAGRHLRGCTERGLPRRAGITTDALDGLTRLWRRVAASGGISQAVALGAAVHGLSLLIQRQLLLEVAHLAERTDLHVLPPLCPVSVSPLDFTRAGELIGRAYLATSAWLADGGDQLPHPERFLSLHDHRPRQHVAGHDCVSVITLGR